MDAKIRFSQKAFALGTTSAYAATGLLSNFRAPIAVLLCQRLNEEKNTVQKNVVGMLGLEESKRCHCLARSVQKFLPPQEPAFVFVAESAKRHWVIAFQLRSGARVREGLIRSALIQWMF
jgi:hypothetical protein